MRLRSAPLGVGGGDADTGDARRAGILDRPVELATGPLQRGGTLDSGDGGSTVLVALTLAPVPLGSVAFVRLAQQRTEPGDRVLLVGYGRLRASTAGHEHPVWPIRRPIVNAVRPNWTELARGVGALAWARGSS